MTNQERLATLSPEECYDKMHWLFFKYALQYTVSRDSIIDWLKSEADPDQTEIYKFAEMEYGEDANYQVLAEGTYKGHLLAVINRGTHPCCYIRIGDLKSMLAVDENTFLNEITFRGPYVPYHSQRGEPFTAEEDGFWIGWDHAHAGDYVGYWYVPEDGGRKYTTDEMIGECKANIDILESFNEKERNMV